MSTMGVSSTMGDPVEQMYDAVLEVLADLPVQRCAGAVAARLASISLGQPDVFESPTGASVGPMGVELTGGPGGDTFPTSASGASDPAPGV